MYYTIAERTGEGAVHVLRYLEAANDHEGYGIMSQWMTKCHISIFAQLNLIVLKIPRSITPKNFFYIFKTL